MTREAIRPLVMDIMRLNPHPGQLDFVKACLCDPDSVLRSKAISTLASHLGANAVDFLQPLLADPDVSTRRAAVAALGQMRHSSVNQVLLRQLEIDPETRAEVIHALVSVGDNFVVSRLVDILQSEKGAARIPIIEVLGQIGDPAAEPALPARVVMRHLVAAAKDSDIPVRRAVVEALAQYADPAARAALARCCLDLDPEVASTARRHTETVG
jgi:HEAT repeat protein